MNFSLGHGHVTPRPDGSKCRCGGPALCTTCAEEKAADDAGRFIKAKVASMGGPREADWAEGRNDFARPKPHLPWIERCLPARSAAFGIGARAYPYRHVVDYGGHEPTVHDFPVTPPPEPGPRRTHVERPERVA